MHSVKQKRTYLLTENVCLKILIKEGTASFLSTTYDIFGKVQWLLTCYTKVFQSDNIKHQIRLFIWASVHITALIIMRNVLLHFLKQILFVQMEKKLRCVLHIQEMLKHFTTQLELTVYWLHGEMWQPLYHQRKTCNLISVRKGLLANMLIILSHWKQAKVNSLPY